jgi:hypothetical protein
MEYSPIVLFVYNRPWHTQQTVEALLKNQEAFQSDLYIFSDGIKSTATDEQISNFKKTREYIHTIKGFKSVQIIEADCNKGLGRSIIDGVTSVLRQYESVIVLEDDIVVSCHFLRFMNESILRYNSYDQVICINSFNIIKKTQVRESSFFMRGGDCLGWATWRRAWKQFNPNAQELLDYMNSHKRMQKDFTFNGTMYYMDLLRAVVDGKNDSWAIRWYTATFINNGLCLYPTQSLSRNIGFGEGATNTIGSDRDQVFKEIQASDEYVEYTMVPVRENKLARKELERIYRSLQYYPKVSLWRRVRRCVKKCINKF